MSEIESEQLREKVIAAIRTVHDPEIPVNVYDLGLIYDVDITGMNDEDSTSVIPQTGAKVHITMTLTTPNCPVAELLPQTVQSKVREVQGVADASIELVFEPPWTPQRMSEDAKLALDYDGSPGAFAGLKKDPFTALNIRKTKR